MKYEECIFVSHIDSLILSSSVMSISEVDNGSAEGLTSVSIFFQSLYSHQHHSLAPSYELLLFLFLY